MLHCAKLIFRIYLINSYISRSQNHLEALQKHEGFVLLCRQLREVAPGIQKPSVLIHCLRALVLCEVDGESQVVAALLELLLEKAYQLSLTDIQLLDLQLSKLESSPFIQNFRTALLSVFETNLETDLERKNLKMMREVFRYACHSPVSPAKVQFIADSLLASDPKKWPISVVCNTLGDMAQRREIPVEPLLQTLLQLLTDQVDQCDKKDLLYLMVRLGRVYKWHIRHWYNQEFCKKVAERVIRERWSLYEASKVCWAFGILPFVHERLLEYFSTLIIRPSKHLTSTSNPFQLIMPFSSTNYKPTNFDKMMSVLLSFPSFKSIRTALSVRTFLLLL